MYSLVYLVVGIPIALGLSYIFKGDTLKDDAFKDEAYEIRMFNRTGRVGLLCFLLCLFLLIIGFAEGSANGWKGVIVLQLIFGIPGIPLLIMYLNHKVIFDKEKLVVSSWLGIKKTIFWNDIIDIKYVVK